MRGAQGSFADALGRELQSLFDLIARVIPVIEPVATVLHGADHFAVGVDGEVFIRVVGVERRGIAGLVVSRAEVGERPLRDVRRVTPVDGDARLRLRDDGGVARDVVIVRAFIRSVALARNQPGNGRVVCRRAAASGVDNQTRG